MLVQKETREDATFIRELPCFDSISFFVFGGMQGKGRCLLCMLLLCCGHAMLSRTTHAALHPPFPSSVPANLPMRGPPLPAVLSFYTSTSAANFAFLM